MTHKKGNDFYLDGDVVRWKSNNAVPFSDTLCEFVAARLITDVQKRASIIKRKAETAEFIRGCIAENRDRKYTPRRIARNTCNIRSGLTPG